VKRLFQAQQQLHTFEAADPQVALEGRLQARCRRRSAKLVYEPGSNGDDLTFDALLHRHAVRKLA
jgi:hypothetical protein